MAQKPTPKYDAIMVALMKVLDRLVVIESTLEDIITETNRIDDVLVAVDGVTATITGIESDKVLREIREDLRASKSKAGDRTRRRGS